MNCSVCNTKLVDGEMREFETVDEHICNPNKEKYPLRPTFVCPKCGDIGFWNDYGSFYGGKGSYDLKFINNDCDAIGSNARTFRFEIKEYKKKLFGAFNHYLFVAWSERENKKLRMEKFNFRFTIRKSNGGPSGLEMLFYCIFSCYPRDIMYRGYDEAFELAKEEGQTSNDWWRHWYVKYIELHRWWKLEMGF